MSFQSPRRQAARSSATSMVETLEGRTLLSAAPLTISKVAPKKIIAGGTGTVAISIVETFSAAAIKLGAAKAKASKTPVSVPVSLTLTPSLSGTAPYGTESLGTVNTTLLLISGKAAKLSVPITVPIDLAGGKFHVFASGTIDGSSITADSKPVFTNVAAAVPTTTPSLIGRYTGLAKGTKSTGTFGGGKKTQEFGIILDITSQTINSITGSFTIGSTTDTGTATGSENGDGTLTYSFSGSDQQWVINKGTVTPDGSVIKGRLIGTFQNNLFSSFNGLMTLTKG